MFVLSGPIDLSGRQRDIVDTGHTNDVPELLAEPARSRCQSAAVPVADQTFRAGLALKSHLSSGTARTKSAVKACSTLLYRTNSSIRHAVILIARFTTDC